MKKKLLLAWCFLIVMLSSCLNKNTKKEQMSDAQTNVAVDSVLANQEIHEMSEEFESQPNIVDILFPSSYWLDIDPTSKINDKWVSLCLDSLSGCFFIKQADFTIEDGYNDCVQEATKDLSSKDNVLLFMNLPDIQKGQINHINIPQERIWPGETVYFEFKGLKYYFRATGTILDTEQTTDGVFHNVENYKLYLGEKDRTEELLLSIKSFNDTFVKLLFIGDIDNDNKPDFIFDTTTWYEDESMTLFLSTKAENGNITRMVANLTLSFAC